MPRSLSTRGLSILLTSCLVISPLLEARVRPSSGFNLFSAGEEVQAGKEASAGVGKQLPLLPDSEPITQYVQRIGADLAAHAPGEKWPYNFHVVNQKEINAFALPGGAIFVNLGTIQAADNEAELAGVMAHEISHVVQRHGTRAASKQMAAQLPLALIGGLLGTSALAQAAQMGISFGVGSYFLKNSRQAEKEADLLGADIMYDTGYDPHAMAQFFGSRAPQFFSDHPDPGNRVVYVSAEVRTLPAKKYRGTSAEFLAVKPQLNGMKPMTAEQIAAWQKEKQPNVIASSTTAPSPSLNTFKHSDYQIAYPDNWQVFGDKNSTVTIAPPNGVSQNAVAYGAMISSYQPEESKATLDQATHALIASLRQSNADLKQIGNDENIRVNGVAGKSVDLIGPSPIKDQNGKATQERDWLVTMKQADGNLLYFIFISPDKDFGKLRPVFEQMLKSVRLR
ncbi:MAG: M48 family metalloprotease [Acidobacteriia bacterium]|nr:M48 family metalloprotease [Terriglobia bacterium]